MQLLIPGIIVYFSWKSGTIYDLKCLKSLLCNFFKFIQKAPISSFQVQKVKNKGVQEYISRTNEKGRKDRRHSSFFVGLSMISWAINDDFHAKN